LPATALCALGTVGAASATVLVSPSVTARRAVLTRAALGHGWTVEAPAPRHAPTLTCRAFAPRPPGVRVRASVGSPTFQAGLQGPFLSQSVYLYGSATQERTVWRQVVIARLLRCAAARFAAGGSGYAVTSSHVSALRRSPGNITRYRIAGTVSAGGQTLPAFLDELVLERGSLITVLDISSLDAPPSDSLERRLAGSAADKLRSAA
jgi:hypothetical protein